MGALLACSFPSKVRWRSPSTRLAVATASLSAFIVTPPIVVARSIPVMGSLGLSRCPETAATSSSSNCHAPLLLRLLRLRPHHLLSLLSSSSSSSPAPPPTPPAGHHDSSRHVLCIARFFFILVLVSILVFILAHALVVFVVTSTSSHHHHHRHHSYLHRPLHLDLHDSLLLSTIIEHPKYVDSFWPASRGELKALRSES